MTTAHPGPVPRFFPTPRASQGSQRQIEFWRQVCGMCGGNGVVWTGTNLDAPRVKCPACKGTGENR